MVFDHLTRMEQFDDSYRAEYEVALKHASITAFIGKISSRWREPPIVEAHWVNFRFCRDGV